MIKMFKAINAIPVREQIVLFVFSCAYVAMVVGGAIVATVYQEIVPIILGWIFLTLVAGFVFHSKQIVPITIMCTILLLIAGTVYFAY